MTKSYLIRVSNEQKNGEYQGHFDQYLLKVKHCDVKIYFPGHWSAVLHINIPYCALVLFSQDLLTWSFKQDFFNCIGAGTYKDNATVLAWPVNSGECTGLNEIHIALAMAESPEDLYKP